MRQDAHGNQRLGRSMRTEVALHVGPCAEALVAPGVRTLVRCDCTREGKSVCAIRMQECMCKATDAFLPCASSCGFQVHLAFRSGRGNVNVSYVFEREDSGK